MESLGQDSGSGSKEYETDYEGHSRPRWARFREYSGVRQKRESSRILVLLSLGALTRDKAHEKYDEIWDKDDEFNFGHTCLKCMDDHLSIHHPILDAFTGHPLCAWSSVSHGNVEGESGCWQGICAWLTVIPRIKRCRVLRK